MGLPVTQGETTLPASEALRFENLIAYAPHGIASRVLAKTGGGNVTIFAFEKGQGLTEHTSPFDALVYALEGRVRITLGGVPHEVSEGEMIVMSPPRPAPALQRPPVRWCHQRQTFP